MAFMSAAEDDPQDCEPKPDPNKLKPAGETTVKQHEEAQAPPPGKTIHPRRPLPSIPDKRPDEEE